MGAQDERMQERRAISSLGFVCCCIALHCIALQLQRISSSPVSCIPVPPLAPRLSRLASPDHTQSLTARQLQLQLHTARTRESIRTLFHKR